MIQIHHPHRNDNDASTLPSTNHHHAPPVSTTPTSSLSSSSSSSSSSSLPTMVVLVSPTLIEQGVGLKDDGTNMDTSVTSFATTMAPPNGRLSMAVHYLPDPYSSRSSHKHSNTSSSSSQLRPYFLMRRERPLLQNSDPSIQNEEEYYQICEMTMIDHIMNKNNISNNTTALDENNNYHSFLIADTNHRNNPISSSSSYIVQDGSMYVMTPIDPLFWLLRDSYLPSTCTTTTSSMKMETTPPNKQQWQPLSQFLQEYDPVIQNCVHGKQPPQPQPYKHLLNEMSLGDDDDDTMILVQFSVEKALVWLHQKQKTVEEHLLSSSFSSLSPLPNGHNTTHCNNNPGGAFASGFTIAKENHTTATAYSVHNVKPNVENHIPPENELKEIQQQQEQQQQEQQRQYRHQVKEESLQLVCNYLSWAWQDHFIQYLKVQDPDFAALQARKDQKQQEQQQTTNTNKRTKSEFVIMEDKMVTTTTTVPITDIKMVPTVDWNMSLTTSTTDTSSTVAASSTSKPKKLLLQPITAGAKRLLKVNQRGIQSVSSFFSVGTKNKSKNPINK